MMERFAFNELAKISQTKQKFWKGNEYKLSNKNQTIL